MQKGFRAGVGIVWLICIPLAVLYFFRGDLLIRFFMSEPTQGAMHTGIQFLRILSPFYFVISAKLVANMIVAAGADRVLTMDLHAAQIQGFFDIPLDHLLGNPTFVDYYLAKFPETEYNHDDFVVVSPDVGSVGRARAFAAKVHMGLAIVDKRRQKANQCEVMNVIGDVEGKECILFDDMVDTAGSLCNAAKAIVEVGGAKKVYACASHGVLSGPALERLAASSIEELALLDTIPPLPAKRSSPSPASST